MVEKGGEEINSKISFEFTITDPNEEAPMKNISHLVLPNFYGLPSEDRDTFSFEFDVVCSSYV